MSLTYSMNQPRAIVPRATAIVLVALIHIGVFIAFNSGFGKLTKILQSPDITVVNVDPDPPPPNDIPPPELPPTATLQAPVPIDPIPVLDVPTNIVESPPSDAVITGAVTNEEVTPPTTRLAALHRIDPIYPSAAQAAGKQGTVLLEVVVDPSGQVVDVHILRSSNFDELDTAAVSAVKQWRFNHPATTVRVRVPITFKLNQRP